MKQVWRTRAWVHRTQQAPALVVRVALCALLASLVLSGCSTMTPPSPASAPPAVPFSAAPRARVITASWYGAELSGRRTSSGEVFNPNQLTAASRSLPIGSHVRVTNVSNGRTVVVRINDRGPFVKGRSIDLSHAAAQHIGLTHKGVGRVRIGRADDSGAQPPPAAVSRVSYATMAAPWSVSRWRTRSPYRQSHTRRRHHRSQRRIVSNPVGDWILSALPHF
jgi:peptidoglycan lytic transglycosylase